VAIMTFRKADDATTATFRSRVKQRFFALNGFDVSRQGWKIVVKGVWAGILRVLLASGALVARAKVAFGVVRQMSPSGHIFDLAQPWTLRSLRGDKDPFSCQQVLTPV
jgi:hypothetical protein